jgi:hypothetical protein
VGSEMCIRHRARVLDATAGRGAAPQAHAAYRALGTAVRRARLAAYNA